MTDEVHPVSFERHALAEQSSSLFDVQVGCESAVSAYDPVPGDGSSVHCKYSTDEARSPAADVFRHVPIRHDVTRRNVLDALQDLEADGVRSI